MKHHQSIDIKEYLMTHIAKRHYFARFRRSPGTPLLSPDLAKQFLRAELSIGHTIYADCDNFDFQGGCLGHPE